MFLLKGISRIVLALTIIMSGLIVCIFVPQTTEMLARATSQASTFGVTEDTIVQASLATRDFALGIIGQTGLENKLETLGLPAGALDSFMLTHLKDCTPIFENIKKLFVMLGMISVVACVVTAIVGGKKSLSKLLWQSSLIAILVIIAFGAWVGFSFDSFFTWMHSLFFTAGTWTFSSSSLLICMYPENFWMGMGIVWGAVSILVSFILIVVSRAISKKR